MRNKLYVIAGILVLSTLAFASKDRGGGDPCEARIQIIRGDISLWIDKGGYKNLQLKNIAPEDYMYSMLSAMEDAQIECKMDKPVQINGIEKVCMFTNFKNSKKISCSANRFMSLSEPDQYQLIHHEYAGISGLEIPNASRSTYWISNQITSNLRSRLVEKLVVLDSSDGKNFLPMTLTELREETLRRINTCDMDSVSSIIKHIFLQGMDNRLSSTIQSKLNSLGKEMRQTWLSMCPVGLASRKAPPVTIIEE